MSFINFADFLHHQPAGILCGQFPLLVTLFNQINPVLVCPTVHWPDPQSGVWRNSTEQVSDTNILNENIVIPQIVVLFLFQYSKNRNHLCIECILPCQCTPVRWALRTGYYEAWRSTERVILTLSNSPTTNISSGDHWWLPQGLRTVSHFWYTPVQVVASDWRVFNGLVTLIDRDKTRKIINQKIPDFRLQTHWEFYIGK